MSRASLYMLRVSDTGMSRKMRIHLSSHSWSRRADGSCQRPSSTHSYIRKRDKGQGAFVRLEGWARGEERVFARSPDWMEVKVFVAMAYLDLGLIVEEPHDVVEGQAHGADGIEELGQVPQHEAAQHPRLEAAMHTGGQLVYLAAQEQLEFAVEAP
jgi:hypothetical protein